MNSPLLQGRDGAPTGNDRRKDVPFHGNTQREGNNIEKEKISSIGRSGLARKDTGLNGGSIGDSLVGVDALSQS